MPWQVVVGSLFLAGGVWVFLHALRARGRRLALFRDSVRTVARVVRLRDITSDGDFQVTYAPVVTYRAADGKTRELDLTPRSNVDDFQVGAKVPILYQRGDPDNAVENRAMWDIHAAFVFSLFLVLVGMMAFVAEARPVPGR